MIRSINNALALTLLVLLPASMGATDKNNYAARSALETGKWVKIQVDNTGIYKITDDDLLKLGFADPRQVSLYGYGGWPLDEDFSKTYTDDLPQLPVYRAPGYLIFYGRGPVKWEYNANANAFEHTNNPYAVSGYYFLSDSGGARAIETESTPAQGAAVSIDTFDDYVLYEEDLYSVNKSGRELFGRSFAAAGSYTLDRATLRMPGITSEPGKVTMRFIARPKSAAGRATLSIDGATLIDLSIRTVSPSDTYNKGIAASTTAEWGGEKQESPAVAVAYNNTGDENVHIDYVRLQAKRNLQVYGEYTIFRSIASRRNASRFVVRNADANTIILDITDGLNPRLVEATLSGNELTFGIPAGELREFAAVQTDRTLGGWKSAGEVGNQNLHGTGVTDMVIIVRDGLRAQAERIASKRRTADGLKVEVVSPAQIYNEFSSGTPDATAYRRFMKMLYDRAGTEAEKPKYLLLFGDGAYDNRLLTAAWQSASTANMLLTYQSANSLNEYSYVTDDYFGSLEDTPFTTAAIQLGIGRIPARTVEEAAIAVDKILAYSDNSLTGAWKNRISFVADDGSSSDSPPYSLEHMAYADRLAELVNTERPGFLVNKIYFDAYKKAGSQYPDVKRNILKQLQDGLLVINYTGHGSTTKLSDEDVLTSSDIARFSYPCLPLWITATCDFTRFDDTSTSAGESVFLQKSGGIAMFTTTRVVYSNNNFALNSLLVSRLFSRNPDGSRLALGDIIRKTKSGLTDTNKFNFILIGDPAMKPAYPEYNIQVTHINGKEVEAGVDIPVKALDRMTVKGRILMPDGETAASNFSGSLNVTVLDSKQTIRTLDNNHTGDTLTFTDYPYTLYTGNNSVHGGNFEFSFTVPKDISYSGDYGLMNLYASADSLGIEAQGYFSDLLIGGSSDNPEQDTEGPEIRELYMNSPAFADGGKVNATPLFVAKLWDKSGVNISGSSIGHDIMLSIDNRPAWNYNLNSAYRLLPDAGSTGEGLVTFSVPALTAGVHTAEFKVWDVANNPTLRTFTFEVIEDVRPLISKIVATPVPARENIQFLIYHDRPESVLQVNIRVYDMSGRLWWQKEESGTSPMEAPYSVEWNLTSDNGSRLRPGVYIYRASIRTNKGEEDARSGKLVILAQ
ncbi:MAG: type IX secretion system sortase PorU [Tannerellaceae bacterium]|jgi:hypothetical protein|nr:type IX secretion system sortase PorU [Tannerellaceae bacterium]